MEKNYRIVKWPEIQDYMEEPDYDNEVYTSYNSKAQETIWFVPEEMYNHYGNTCT